MMLIQDKKIAIIGGGPGGLTLARLLLLQGAAVQVYERDADKHARVQGAPLDLHDESGLAAIRKAGLLDAFKANYMRGADREKIMNTQADVFYSDHDTKVAEDFGAEGFRPEIDRGVLRQLLIDSLPNEGILWDSHFLSMERQGEGWLLHFKNREPAYADLVIGADGANSKIRPYITDIKAFYSGITMLEGNIANAATAAPQISQMIQGGKIMAFGNGQTLLMGQKGNGEIGFYACQHWPESWAKDNGLDYTDREAMLAWFQKEFAMWSPVWHELFTSVTPPFIPRPIYCMPLNQTWQAQPNVTLLGDAAHLMPPFAGEGVNMAMQDALELCEHITNSNYHSLQEAIAHYEDGMRNRASLIAQESLDNGARMHGENALSSMVSFFSGE